MGKFKNKSLILILIVFLLIPLIPLLNQGLPLTHDGRDHVARIANFYQGLSEGNIVPRWAGNLNWGYGHPILEFLYPLPSYFASSFHFLGFSLVDSTKIVFALGFALSGIFMYLWLSAFLKKEEALFGAALYSYAPYRFVDLYVRGAIGENFAFIFMPLVLYFTYRLYKRQSYFNLSFLAMSLACLILSHNAISLIFLPFIIFYGILLWSKKKFQKSYILNFVSSIAIGFALSAFFWAPSFLEGRYTLRNILTSGTYINRFVDFKALIYGSWSYGGAGEFTVQLGLIHWIALIVSFVSLFYFLKKKKKNYWLVLGGVVYSIAAMFLMLKQSNFIWQHAMILQNFQFPWRLLAITVFSTSLLGALSISLVKEKLRKTVVFILLIVLFLLSLNYMKPNGYLIKPESFYAGVFESTTDTGESSPIWSVRFMEKKPVAHLEVLDGDASIAEIKRTSVNHEYSVNVRKKTLFAENTLYFPGWTIKANGQTLPIEYQNMQHRGIMLFFLDPGSYNVKAQYGETKLRLFADMVSALFLFCVVVIFIFKFVKAKL
jgi:hypothetical protein